MDKSQHFADRQWTIDAVATLQSDANRSADTHLHKFPLPPDWGVQLYLKDESVHPTGSLKHRLARSLLLHGLVNGDIGPRTTLLESSSGSTAVSIAYFAQILGLRFVAVMPRSTSRKKVRLMEHYGATCHFVEQPGQMYAEAARLGEQPGWFYLDQFSNAGTATDWRGNNNIAQSIFEQMALEENPEPTWIVCGAGTGGTSATVGRYCRYIGARTRIAVVDPEGSAFYEAWQRRDPTITGPGSGIEGIGRPRVEPAFVPAVIDELIRIPDTASIAAARWLRRGTGIFAGGSTGTNLIGSFRILARMLEAGETGSVVTLICDRGDRYTDTYFSDEWLQQQGLVLDRDLARLDEFMATGRWAEQ